MNEKKAKALRRTAKIMAGTQYDSHIIYKFLKELDKNEDAAMARVRNAANKSTFNAENYGKEEIQN